MLLGYTTNPLYFTYIYFRDISNCHTSCYPLSNHISIQIYESFKDISNNYTSYYFLSNHDITLLRVLKKVKSEINGGNNSDYSAKLYTARKMNVYDALAWLKKHKQNYKSIDIDPTALDWLDEGDGDSGTSPDPIQF